MTENKLNKERIAKKISSSGLGSRREIEKWIFEGRITVDNKVIKTPAYFVFNNNEIKVDGKPIPQMQRARLWRYYKPRGLITSHNDPQGRKTVFETLAKTLPRVISIGRLDINSEGLLLLTNNGFLARKMEHPKFNWTRKYRVRVHGNISQKKLDSLNNNLNINGQSYKPIIGTLEKQLNSNAWISMKLKEGKNREIRKIMDYYKWPVSRLIRTKYGPFSISNLKPGELEEVPLLELKKNKLLD